MPVIKSAIKKLRQAKTRAAGNRRIRNNLRDLISKFRAKPGVKIFPKLASALDKAAKTNVIHRNKASRLQSRLSKLL
ncbi:MAG: 30S ribosomal protein S20 [Patescibacteria group bacterium]